MALRGENPGGGGNPPAIIILREKPRQGISLRETETGKEGDFEKSLLLNSLEDNGPPEFPSRQTKRAQLGEGAGGSEPEASGDFRTDFHKTLGKGAQKFEIAMGVPQSFRANRIPERRKEEMTEAIDRG